MKGILSIGCFFLAVTCFGQSSKQNDWPIILSLDFHALSLPFKKIGSNFKNVGIGIGTQLSYNDEETWVQRFQAIYYLNRNVGNGLMIHSQLVRVQKISDNEFGEIKIGVGYLYAFRPNTAWEQTNGEWKQKGKKGKSMFVLPIGLGVASTFGTHDQYHYTSYQALFLTGYNESIPLVPESLIEFGTLIRK